MKVVMKTVRDRLDELMHSSDYHMIKHVILTKEEYCDLMGEPYVIHTLGAKRYAGLKLIVEEDD